MVVFGSKVDGKSIYKICSVQCLKASYSDQAIYIHDIYGSCLLIHAVELTITLLSKMLQIAVQWWYDTFLLKWIMVEVHHISVGVRFVLFFTLNYVMQGQLNSLGIYHWIYAQCCKLYRIGSRLLIYL